MNETAKEPMTPRERWLAVLQRESPDRMPMDYWATQEATRRLLKHLGCATVWQMYKRLHIDRVVTLRPKYAGPRLRPGYDIYGRRHKNITYSGGAGVYRECVHHPLAAYNTIAEIERNYTWPTADWFDYSEIPQQAKRRPDYPLQGGGSEPFLIYKDLRGMEQAYMDMVINPELVHYCLDKLFDFCYQNTLRIYEQAPGQVMLSYIAEDFGGQDTLLFSAAMIREFFIPRMKRMMDLAHSAGVYVFFHSDGAIRSILPDMIAAGIDVLNPIQWRCKGMEREALKRDFGDQVIFHGGMDNQQTLPFGTVEEVRQEVID
ncbi:MAG TPA: uroporphyrinogen decarboxylase family protein, partial [Caldilineaceae bacterium]|nr:uroporphyrinogen decarboxylase family protein [Caldilineaceae bacterium]